MEEHKATHATFHLPMAAGHSRYVLQPIAMSIGALPCQNMMDTVMVFAHLIAELKQVCRVNKKHSYAYRYIFSLYNSIMLISITSMF